MSDKRSSSSKMSEKFGNLHDSYQKQEGKGQAEGKQKVALSDSRWEPNECQIEVLEEIHHKTKRNMNFRPDAKYFREKLKVHGVVGEDALVTYYYHKVGKRLESEFEVFKLRQAAQARLRSPPLSCDLKRKFSEDNARVPTTSTSGKISEQRSLPKRDKN